MSPPCVKKDLLSLLALPEPAEENLKLTWRWIQSMFSMTFFNWNSSSSESDDHSVVSGSIWIYFLVTVVFTLVTLMLFWYFILSRQRNRRSHRRVVSNV
jgi:hypothetical protein